MSINNQGTTFNNNIETEDGFKIVPKQPKPKYTLAELLSQCKPENRQDTIDVGIVGKELI